MNEKPEMNNKKIVINAIYGFSGWIIPLVISFFSTKFLIEKFGPDEFGIYTLVLSFTGYSFTFNISRALTKYISEFTASGEIEKLKRIFSATVFVTFCIVLFSIPVMFGFSSLIVSEILKIEERFYAETLKGLYFAGVIILFTLFAQLFSAVLQGIHRFDLISKISTGTSVVLLLGNIIIALTKPVLELLFIWNLAVTVIIFLLNFLTAKALYPSVIGLNKFDKKSLGEVLKYSLSIVGYQILGNFLLLFERGFLTRNYGTEVLTYYVVPMTVSWQIHYFVTSLVQVIFPLAGELGDNPEKLKRLYLKATRLIFLLVFFICFLLILQSSRLFTVWLGQEFADKSSALLIIHLLSYSIVALTSVIWQLNDAKTNPEYNFALTLLTTLITTPLIIYLSENLASKGVAVARLLGFVPWIFALILLEKKYFGKFQISFWLGILSKLFLAGLVMYFFERILSIFIVNNFFELFISIIVNLILYFTFVWFCGLINENEKMIFKSFIGIGKYS